MVYRPRYFVNNGKHRKKKTLFSPQKNFTPTFIKTQWSSPIKISRTGSECGFRKVITGQLVVIRVEGATMEWCNNELTQFILGWCGRGTAAVWRPADYIQHRDAPPLRTLRHRTMTEHCGHAHAQPDLHE